MATKSKKKTPTPEKDQQVIVNESVNEQLRKKVIELMKKGATTAFISQHLNNIICLTENEVLALIDESATSIKNEYSFKLKDVKALHLKRYHDTIEKLLNTKELDESLMWLPTAKGGITEKQFITSRNKKIKAYDRAMDTMRQLEDLMGVVHNDLTVELNNDIEINEHKFDSGNYDLTKITLQEQIRLLELFQKARVDTTAEPGSVIEIPYEEVAITEEAVTDVLPTANIEQIKKLELIDMSPQPIFAIDPIARLKETLRKQAAQAINDAGGHLNEEEKRLL